MVYVCSRSSRRLSAPGRGYFSSSGEATPARRGDSIHFDIRYMTLEHSLDAQDQWLSSKHLHKHIEHIRGRVRAARSILEPFLDHAGPNLSPGGPIRYVKTILSAAASPCPTVARSSPTVSFIGGNKYANRQRLDSASALTCLG